MATDSFRMEHEKEMLSDVAIFLRQFREHGTTLPSPIEIYHLEMAFSSWLAGLTDVAEAYFLTAKTLKERRLT